MPKSEENEPLTAIADPPPIHPATVVTGHEGEDGLTVGRLSESDLLRGGSARVAEVSL
jgi:hypothetical protein